MSTFVTTIKFTEQGIANIGDTTKRAEVFRGDAERMGAQVTDILWTIGAIDGLIIFDAPDEETAAALMLQLGKHGAVQTQTSRAFREAEVAGLLSKLTG